MSEAVHDAVKIGIVSISDRASSGVYDCLLYTSPSPRDS